MATVLIKSILNDCKSSLIRDKMGYRSNVAYMIAFHDPEQYWSFIAESKCDPDTSDCWTEWEDDMFKQNDDDLSIQFSADDIKWYSNYKDVMCHENLWYKAEQRLENTPLDFGKGVCSGYFTRIGEAEDDIDSKVFGDAPPYDFINLYREIKVKWKERV